MNEVIKAMGELDEAKVLEMISEFRTDGASIFMILGMLNNGMLLVGEKFEQGEYFLADLILSGIIYRKALEILGARVTARSEHCCGKVLVGVVKDDIHDIGKDIIVSTLQSGGFEVMDLGTDVRSNEFVSAAMEFRPNIIALSGTMSYAVHEMQLTIGKLREAKICEFAKIIVGGLCLDQEGSLAIGADFFS
jgi:methanogenic corrinoid protein MtbC1